MRGAGALQCAGTKHTGVLRRHTWHEGARRKFPLVMRRRVRNSGAALAMAQVGKLAMRMKKVASLGTLEP